jgi:hypothetical protein
MAAVLPPRGLPTKSEFFRFRTMRFISRSLTLLSMGTAPSEQKTFSSFHCKRLIFPSGRIGNFVWWWAKCPLILGGHLLGVGR